jgi:hypothetical protein
MGRGSWVWDDEINSMHRVARARVVLGFLYEFMPFSWFLWGWLVESSGSTPWMDAGFAMRPIALR